MIKLIQSSRLPLPMVYLVETIEDIKELPLGIPFIRSNIKDYQKCVKILEYEVLWNSLKSTGFKLKWENFLKEKGFTNFWKFGVASSTKKLLDSLTCTSLDDIPVKSISNFINDISYKVDLDVLKNLKLLPEWFKTIEENININILDSINYNPSLYTKKLDLMLGGIELSHPSRNVIIIDISGSIPKGVSSTILTYAKTFAEKFYADLLITGSKSTLYDYNKLDSLNIDDIYMENGMDNDQYYYKNIMKEHRKYNTVLVFGDYHNPGQTWSNSFNKRTKIIPIDEGKKLCNWEIENIISFHMDNSEELAGYSIWFEAKNITHIKNWVIDLN